MKVNKAKTFDAAIAIISPHFDEIEAEFDKERRRFSILFSQEHDAVGRILKCHLVLENYLDRHLAETLGLKNIDDARLSFYQKAALLPSERSVAALVKPGILRVNKIRNRFAHNLNARIDEDDLRPMAGLLRLSRPGVETAEPVTQVENFAVLACTWLIPARADIKELFERAIATVDLSALDINDPNYS